MLWQMYRLSDQIFHKQEFQQQQDKDSQRQEKNIMQTDRTESRNYILLSDKMLQKSRQEDLLLSVVSLQIVYY